MAIVCPDVGEVVLHASVLYPASGENWTLKLFSNNITPAESDTAGTYTEATFTGYVAKTITRTQSGATWAVPTTSAGTTSSTYGTAQSWSPTTSQTIYGYYVIGATSTTLLFAEVFSSAKNLVNGDTLTITPRLELA
jgi:hypothetical protein